MKRCKNCNAPLTIHGTHCNQCGTVRDDIEEQNQQARRRDPVTNFLVWVVGSFFSVTFLLWFAACAGLGAGVGCAGFYLLGLNKIVCWVIGIVVTVFVYGLTWVMLIWGGD